MSELDERAAFGLALKLLARREHSQSELRAKLKSKGAPSAVISEVLSELGDRDLQSDARFGESYVRSRAARGFGPRRIRRELRERGLDDLDCESALAGAEIDWFSLAIAARTKKFGDNTPLEAEDRFRQMRHLEYRGFNHEQIQEAMASSRSEDC